MSMKVLTKIIVQRCVCLRIKRVSKLQTNLIS